MGNTIGKVAGTTIDIVKKARELKQNGLTNEIAEKILKENNGTAKTENGFYYIK